MSKRIAALLILLLSAQLASAATSRIKDLAVLEGQADEELLGYGLVVGLNGTGDGQSSAYTVSSLTSMLERLGVTVDDSDVKLKNVAAVLITAKLPPSATPGSRIDVKVSSLGDASSLEGGELIMTPLSGVDGQIYAVAQGAVSIGGFNVSGGANNSIRKNHAVVGMVPNGGRVTTKAPGGFMTDGVMAWLLYNPDFTTAQWVCDSINASFGAGTARAVDAQRVVVNVPESYVQRPVEFIARMGGLASDTDQQARVVINGRTGTIIVGRGVRLHEAAVAHGNLKVVIKTNYDVSQPNSFNESGQTVVVPSVMADVEEPAASVLHVPETSTVADVVAVLNEAGASPRDISAILQALKQAGALQAELVIM